MTFRPAASAARWRFPLPGASHARAPPEDQAALCDQRLAPSSADDAQDIARDVGVEALTVRAGVELNGQADDEIARQSMSHTDEVCEVRGVGAVRRPVALLARVDQVHR